MPDLPRAYLTTAEVAKRFRTSPETIRWWRFAGRGPQGYIRPGRQVLYPIEAVEAFEEDLLAEAEAETAD